MTEEELNERQRRRRALLLIPLLLLGAALCFWTLFASVSLGEAESFIPAPLGSDALANYGKDNIPGRLRSLSISIVEAVIRDRDPEEEDIDSRVEDVSDSLKSPVPTVTPKPGDPTGTPTSPPTATSTPDLSVTGTVTATGSPSPSPIPSRTPTATKTDVPTAGPTSTSGPSPTPSNTPTNTPTPSNTPTNMPSPTPCKVIPELWVHFPVDGWIYNSGDEIVGEAHAWDPDNVNPSDCSPTPEKNGDGIVEVEFRVKQFGVPEFISTDLTKKYCAFGGGSPCIVVPVNGGIWPDSTLITGGIYEMHARAKDDEGQWSLWDYTTFTINLPTPTPTPSSTPTPTSVPPTDTPIPAPTDTPIPGVCALITIDNFDPGGGSYVTWDVINANGSTVTITQIDITWPGSNDSLEMFRVGGSVEWTGSDDEPSANLSLSGNVSTGGPWKLRFEYEGSVASSPYNVTFTFNGSCTVSADHNS